MNSYVNADYKDVLPFHTDKSFKLALLDPPYGIGYDKGSSSKAGKFESKKIRVARGNYHSTNWDNKTPDDWFFKEVKRVSKMQMIFGGNYFKALLHLVT